jgi:glutamate transport system substrate-binding protein
VLALAALAALGLVAGCSKDTAGSKLLTDAGDGHLTIGVSYTIPGLGAQGVTGKVAGFDIDVAKYVAGRLGVDEDQITWHRIAGSMREQAINSGTVDMVVDAYSITPGRKKKVTFAGPYFIAGQDLLVRKSETDITGPRTLGGKKLCSVANTTSAEKVKKQYASHVQLAEYDVFSGCVNALLEGLVDAVTTDNAVLAGYVAKYPELLRLVGKPFSTERYGIGLAKGDQKGQAKVADALQKMMSSGAWKRALQDTLGPSGIADQKPPKITEH